MSVKSQKDILAKLGIERLNPMQNEAHSAIKSDSDVVLLSPTGTGKTLAFLLPLVARLDTKKEGIQALVLVPSRELAIQIEQVFREMGSGYKANVVYGGRAGSKDREELKHLPALLIGTPGRVADHIRRNQFETRGIKTLVLDEFDKSLEIGFEDDMRDIIEELDQVDKRILTSATKEAQIPKFVGLNDPIEINYLNTKSTQLEIKIVDLAQNSKFETLVNTLSFIGDQPGIIFCNFKDDIAELSDSLFEEGIEHGCFYGNMEQKDRERVLIKFRNGTHRLIIATDLAARGLDIPELKFIIHYQLPPRSQEFTHRNGRTARMNSDGTAYIILEKRGRKPEYIEEYPVVEMEESQNPPRTNWSTLFISGGRKDKISKGDIAGLLMKQGKLSKEQVGVIELKSDCAFVGVQRDQAKDVVKQVNNVRLKKKKVRVSVI